MLSLYIPCIPVQNHLHRVCSQFRTYELHQVLLKDQRKEALHLFCLPTRSSLIPLWFGTCEQWR